MSRKSQRRHKKMRKTHTRKYRGGSGAPNPDSYSSAATYGMAVNGTGDSQYERVFSQMGPDANSQSNAIMGLQGQKAGKRMRKGGVDIADLAFAPRGGAPTVADLAFAPRGGSGIADLAFAPRGGKSRRKRGGFIGQVVNQAIVPFGILGMQQMYRKGARSMKKTRRHRRR